MLQIGLQGTVHKQEQNKRNIFFFHIFVGRGCSQIITAKNGGVQTVNGYSYETDILIEDQMLAEG